MAISFGSINTGLPPNIVQQLVEAEKQPIKALEARKGKVQEQLKLVDDLTTKVREIHDGLRELGNTRGFADMKLVTGDPNIIAGTADRNVARPGTTMIEVEKLAHKTSAVSNGFPDKNESQVGVGYIRFKTAEGNKDIYVDNKNNTLDKVARLINSKSMGLQASVIKDNTDKEAPYRLMLTGKGVGDDKGIEFPAFYFLDGDQDFYLEKERPAENGKVKVDGFEFEIAENKLDDVIPGVTLELRQAAPGREIAVSVGEDKELIVGKIKTFVEKMNGVFQFIQSQNAIDQNTDTSKTLGGDSTLRTIETRLRNILQSPAYGVHGDIKYLNQVGIGFNRNGQLSFDEEKFNSVLAKQLPDVTEFFIGDNLSVGLVPQIKNAIGQMLDGVNGPLTQRHRGLKSKVDQFDQQISNKERVLTQKEAQLKRKFAHLEETMSQLKSQGQALQARLGTGGGDFGLNLKQG